MKSIKKSFSLGLAFAIISLTSIQISAMKNEANVDKMTAAKAEKLINDLKAQKIKVSSTIAQWPISSGGFHPETGEQGTLKQLLVTDISNIKKDLESVAQAIVWLIQKQQETLQLLVKGNQK